MCIRLLCGNPYPDLSGTGMFRYGMLAAGVKRVGSGRLMCRPFERISKADRETIFYRNAARLLGIAMGKALD